MWYRLMSKHENEWPYGIPKRDGKEGRWPGGFACAIQPHCEVRPEFGLSIYEVYDMKACRILTPFWAIGEGDEEEEEKGRGRQGASYDHSSYRIVGVRIYPLTLASALAQHLVRWGEEGSEGGRGSQRDYVHYSITFTD